jgi:hypothetical protein
LLLLFVTRTEHVGDMRGYMVFKNELVERGEGLLDCQALGDNVHAVRFVVDHLLQALKLAFNNLGAVDGAFFDCFVHVFSIIPPGGISQLTHLLA